MFEEAREKSEEMLSDNEQIEEVVAEEAPTENVTDEQVLAEEEAVIENAVQTAEEATQQVAQRDTQLNEVMGELEALRNQNAQLQGMVEELSARSEERVVEEALTPPELDINSLTFADEETQKAAVAKFTESLLAQQRQELKKEFDAEYAPIREYAKKGMYEDEKAKAIEALAQIPKLSGISEIVPQLEIIISKNKALSSGDIPLEEKLITAFMIAKGANSMNNPKREPNTEELMALYESNPEFREAVEKKRISEMQNSQQVPVFSASSGAANAALNINNRPESWDEALERSRKQLF